MAGHRDDCDWHLVRQQIALSFVLMRKAFVDRWSLRLPLRQAIETLVIAVLLGTIHFASASVFQDFYWKDWRGIRWIAILMSLCPMALGYLLLRFAFPPLIAAALLGVLSFALGYIHWTKLGLTAEPFESPRNQ